MNPLGIFYSPGKTIEDAFKKPDMVTAIILVILSGIIGIIGSALYGFGIHWGNVLLKLFSNIVFWLILSALLYLLLFFFKRYEIRGKFSGVASCLSLFGMIGAVLSIVFLLFPFALSSPLFGMLKQYEAKNISMTEFAQGFATVLSEQPNSINLSLIAAIFVVSLILVIYAFILSYLLISRTAKLSIPKNLLIWIAFLVIVIILQLLS